MEHISSDFKINLCNTKKGNETLFFQVPDMNIEYFKVFVDFIANFILEKNNINFRQNIVENIKKISNDLKINDINIIEVLKKTPFEFGEALKNSKQINIFLNYIISSGKKSIKYFDELNDVFGLTNLEKPIAIKIQSSVKSAKIKAIKKKNNIVRKNKFNVTSKPNHILFNKSLNESFSESTLLSNSSSSSLISTHNSISQPNVPKKNIIEIVELLKKELHLDSNMTIIQVVNESMTQLGLKEDKNKKIIEIAMDCLFQLGLS